MSSDHVRTLRLKAEHVDCFRRLRLSVLMRLFQECCISHTEELGMGRKKTLDRGLLWVINAETILIRRMPEYDEEVTLTCSPGRTLHYFFPRRMSVLDKGGNELIRIGALWSLISEKTRQLADPNEAGVAVNGEDRPGDLIPELSLREPELPFTAGPVTASYSMVDINGHINNASCMDLVLDLAGFEELRKGPFSRIHCIFRKEIPAGTEFLIRWGKTEAGLFFRTEYFTISAETGPAAVS